MKINGTTKLRIFLWTLLLIATGFFIYMAVVPGGKISYSYDFSDPSRFITKLTPIERLDPISEGAQKITGDPVYFTLNSPRGFDKARLSIKYKNSSDDLPIIEAGILTDNVTWNYNLQPLENKIIDDLSLVWNKIENNGLLLLQKEKKYDSIDQFLKNPPARNEVALYNYAPEANDFKIADYKPNGKENVMSAPLRGGYEFYTYIDNEELDFKFLISDLNLKNGDDKIDLNLYYNGALIDSKNLSDDGDSSDDGRLSKDRELIFRIAGLPAGAYKMVLRAGDDVVTKKIVSKQKIAFNNKLWLADNNTGLSIFTDSSEIFAQTSNPASLQIIKIGDNELQISDTYKQFEKRLNGGIEEIKIPTGDLMISGNGVFSFNKSDLFNPDYKKVDANLDAKNVDYILAKYSAPKNDGDWKIARADFDLTKAYTEKGKNGFLISVPGLKTDDSAHDNLEITEIKMELEGKSFKEKILELLKKRAGQ